MPRSILPAVILLLGPAGDAAPQGPSKLEIAVDPRVELFSIVQVIGDRMDNGLDFPYKREVLAHFGRFKDHEAVRRIQAMVPDGLSWGIPASLGVAVGPLPGLGVIDSLPTMLAIDPVNADSVAAYVRAVSAFARESGFEQFFREHRPYYDSLVVRVQRTLGSRDWIGDVERQWGWEQAGYHIYLSPLMPAGGVGPSRSTPSGQLDVYSIIGTFFVRDSQPVFGGRNAFEELLLHEFSHSFVNPTTDASGAEVDRWSLLLYPLQHRLRQADGLTTWRMAVNEFILRAFTANMLAETRGDSVAEDFRSFQRMLGFEYIEQFSAWLTEFNASRDRYPTFRDYYPRLLEHMAALAGSGLAPERFNRHFRGDISMARWHDENMFWVFILPTAEADSEAQQRLGELVRTLRMRQYPSSFIITDRDALSQDLSRYALYVWGTPEGNLWLRQHRDALPITITPDAVVTDSVWSDTMLTVTAAVPSPLNRSKPMIVSTGQRIADVAATYWVWSADFAVMRGTKQVQIGDFPVKGATRWSFDGRPTSP